MSASYQEMLREMTTQVIVETGLTESIAHKCAVAVMTVLQEKKAAAEGGVPAEAAAE